MRVRVAGWPLTVAAVGLSTAGFVLHAPPGAAFVLEALSVSLLARHIGWATGSLANAHGPQIGALLSAAFGNVVELMIAIMALRAGLYDVVKASIVGSMLANLLLTLGVCMIVGGMRRQFQHFNQVKAGVNSTMLFTAVAGLAVTSVYALRHGVTWRTEALSIGVSTVFLVVYILGLVFSMGTHRALFTQTEGEAAPGNRRMSRKEIKTAWFELAVATLLVAPQSDLLVHTVQPLAQGIGLRPDFIGLIFLPMVGAAPEFFSAIVLSRRNQMEGSMEIAVGSSLQIALFVAPVLVLSGALMARPLNLVFTPMEVIMMFLAAILTSLVSLDGETNWFEGTLVTATYLLFALLFLFK